MRLNGDALAYAGATKNPEIDKTPNVFILQGEIIGYHSSTRDENVDVLYVTFKFSPTKITDLADLASIQRKPNQTDVIRVFLKSDGNVLRFVSAKYLKTIEKRPVIFK